MSALALAYILALGAVATGLGWPLVVRLDKSSTLNGAERVMVAFLLGVIGIYFAVFAVGSWRLDGFTMGGVSIAALMASLPGLRGMPWGRLRAAIGEAIASARRSPLEAGLWLALIGTLVSVLVQGMAPPNDYDSLMYHLAGPKLDVERGVIAPIWQRGMPHFFFPALAGHLYRLILASMGEPAVQMVTGLFGIAGSIGAAALGRRMNLPRAGWLLAALMFAACRFMVWEMATAEVEVALSAYAVAALVVFMAWRSEGGWIVVLGGLMLGGGLLTKFHGIAVAIAVGLPMAVVAIRRPGGVWQLTLASVAGIAMFVPHMAVMAAITGNPLYPMFNNVFTQGGLDYFTDLRGAYGIGRDPLAILLAPVAMSVLPMRYFDGMTLGAPYLVALAPLAVLLRPRLRHVWPVAAAIGIYYLIWFYLLSQQVRFLAPVIPMVAVFAGAGAIALVQRSAGVLRFAAVAVLAMLALNQGMFVAIYSILRLPPALGLVSPAAFHANTPTMTGAFYATCTWITQRIKSGEAVLSVLTPHSYYCPQAAAVTRIFPGEERAWQRTGRASNLSRDEFLSRFREGNYRYVIVSVGAENRRNEAAEPIFVPVDLAESRLGIHLKTATQGLKPLAVDQFTAVFDGREVLSALEGVR